ncbi:MAG TPA: DUF5924 family protein [Solimonas sp.]
MTTAAEPIPRWQAWWARWRHAVALLSFAAGVASFFLFERQEKVAQTLVILLPLSWLLVGLEPWLLKRAQNDRLFGWSPLLLTWLTQGLHQESFFFTLPFFLATTTWLSPQAGFIGLLMLAALGSMIDPFYFRHVLQKRWLLWAFHAAAGFITTLAAAPMLWHLTTAQSLKLAAGCLAVLSVPAWASALSRLGGWRWLPALVLGALLGALVLQLRTAIPPATLRVTEALMTTSIEPSTKAHGPALKMVDETRLRQEGLYAWTSIRAPRGLAERIEHHWVHQGQIVDRIAIQIQGGRERGYRAWTHKRAFPATVRGDWEVRVVTEGGQLIGITRFRVP